MKTDTAIHHNVTIKHLNTFGIETHVEYFSIFENTHQLLEILSVEQIRSLPKLILGEGSNILFTKNFAGIVLKNGIKGIELIKEDDHHLWIKAGAGENWHDFVIHCIDQGYSGLENLSLIPGTVGATPIQNIGAYGVEVSDLLHELEALKLDDGTIHTFTNKECKFGYRDSIFKSTHKNQFAILSVIFKLDKKPKLQIDYGNLKETLKQMGVEEINSKAISDAVIHIRRGKLPDPKVLGNAGSFFKNPIISSAQFDDLQKKFPQIPHFSIDNSDAIKINAAWLIEQCGWKGKRFGDIGVYDKQALILVNHGNGSGTEILELSQKIQRSVHDQFGIHLEPEVNLI